jgi:hypothetical protein
MLAAVLMYHELPPIREHGGAVWTAPFMRPGTRMRTALPDGSTVSVAGSNASEADVWDLSKIKLVGGGGAAACCCTAP